MRLLRKQLISISLLLALVGCDDKNMHPTQENRSQTALVESSKTSQDSPTNSFLPSDDLIKKYHDKQLEVLDASEMILDGSSTLIITFSVPLNPKQNFSSLVRLIDSKTGDVEGNWELSNSGLELRYRYLDPDRKLTLTIDKMLLAINDNRLTETYQKTITTQDRKPMVGFASSGFLLPKESMNGLPVITLNVDKVDVNFFKIKSERLTDFMSDVGLISQVNTWDARTFNHYMDLVYSSRFDLNVHRNAQERVILNIAPIAELQSEGVYLAIMNQAGSYRYSNPATIFSKSNIGLSVHRYQNGKLSIFTNAIDSGAQLADINLSLYCRTTSTTNKGNDRPCRVKKLKTDKFGYAEVQLPKVNDYFLLTATSGNELSFLTINSTALDLSEYTVSGDPFYQKQLFTFGPRDLYRPNETVSLNALLRDSDGQLIADQPIKVDILTPNGQSVKDFVWQPTNKLKVDPKTLLNPKTSLNPKTLEQHGFYQTEYTIPSNGATGRWAFRFNLGDDDLRYHYFSVEDFMPERMALDITAPSNRPILINETLNFNLKGWYLYGAPASGNRIAGNIYIKKVDELPELPNFKIGSVTESDLNHKLDSIDQQLDSHGVLQVSINSEDLLGITSPVNAIFQASLLDDGGIPVTRTASQMVWPTENIPAIRALFKESTYYNWQSDRYEDRAVVNFGESADFEVAYINSQGQKLPTDDLTLRIVRERNESYWSFSDYDGWQLNQNSKTFIVSEDPLSIPESGIAKVSYRGDEHGAYRIEIIDKKTNVISSMRFWNGYDWESGLNDESAIRPDQIKLSLDKKSYIAGDVAKVHVESPITGSGYLALENSDGMFWRQAITVTEQGADVEIPIKEWQRHDIYLNAMIISPKTEMHTVKRAIGLHYLPIDSAARELHLKIDVPKKVEPKKEVTIKLQLDKASIKKDHQVMVLVSAVDSGILNIDNFVTPDPYNAFLGRKRYDVDLYDIYGKLIEGDGRQVNMRFGGDALASRSSAGGKKPLTAVKIVAQQFQVVALNDNGEGELHLTIPDFNGELRLMAQVWDDDRFGKAEETTTVAAPIVAELSSPRFLAGGDHSTFVLDLNNLTNKTQMVQVNISSSGLIHHEMVNSKTVTLTTGQREMIKIPVTADNGYGEGHLNIQLTGIKVDDGTDYQLSQSWQIGVRPAYPETVKNYSVTLNKGERWAIPDEVKTDLIHNTITSEFVISNQPTLSIAQYIKSLFAYPYGCLEQTVSGLYPALYANQEQLTTLGIKTESDTVRHEKVQQGIDRIFGMQRSNGSFGLWSRESDEEYWLTVYATDFLLKARERGYQVNSDGLERALKRLEAYIYDSTAFQNSYLILANSEYLQVATKSYAAMILAQQNHIMPAIRNQINQLSDYFVDKSVKKALISPLPVAQLALAAKLVGFEKVYEKLMPIALTTDRNDNSNWLGDYGSNIRDRALIYTLLVENSLAVDKQASYLVSLTSLLNGKRYFSTQELNALFLAAWEIEQHRPPKQFTYTLNGNTIKADKTVTGAFNALQGFNLANDLNDQPLYLNVSVSGYSKKMPLSTADNGLLTIKRHYYNMDGKAIISNQFTEGDLVLVLLDITANRSINDALVIDFLPAGLQLENQNLMNSSVNLRTIPEIADLLQKGDSSAIKYQEYRDDRYVAAVELNGFKPEMRLAYLARAVTVGSYMNPNPFVESMYHPEWFAIGKAPAMITINAKDLKKTH